MRFLALLVWIIFLVAAGTMAHAATRPNLTQALLVFILYELICIDLHLDAQRKAAARQDKA